MKSKQLIFKKTYDNISSNKEIPDISIEDIREILLEINKGIVWGTTMPPYDHTYKVQNFKVNFRNMIPETRNDITFCYKYKYEVIDKETNRIIGYRLGTDIQMVDAVSFFTKIKDNKAEHRIYQIGGRYSESSQILDKFKEKVAQNSQDFTPEQMIQFYEKIKSSKSFDSYDYPVKHHILQTLEQLYFTDKNTVKADEIFDEMMELRFIEDLEFEPIIEQEPILLTESEKKEHYKDLINYLLELATDESPKEINSDLQKEDFMHLNALSNEEEIYWYALKMIQQAKNFLTLISNELLPEFLQALSEFAYQNKFTKFIYMTSTDLKSYEDLIKKMHLLGNLAIESAKFTPIIYFILRDFDELLVGKDNKFCIVIKEKVLIKKLVSIMEHLIGLEIPFIKESPPDHKGSKISPSDLGAILEKGSNWINNREFDKAILLYKEQVEKYPEEFDLLRNLGSAYLEKYEDEKDRLGVDPTISLTGAKEAYIAAHQVNSNSESPQLGYASLLPELIDEIDNELKRYFKV